MYIFFKFYSCESSCYSSMVGLGLICGSFGRFLQSYGFSSKLDSLLEKESTTLEDILNEENILMELRGSSSSKFATLYVWVYWSI